MAPFRRIAAVCIFSLHVALSGVFAFAAPQDEQLVELYTKAQQAQRASDFPSAAKYYEQIVKARPDLAEAFANLGTVYYQMGDAEKAAAALKQAVTLKPDLSMPHFFLGVISAQSRKYQDGVTYLEKAQRLDPSNLFVSFYLGVAHYGLGDYQRAAVSFEKAAASDEFKADSYYHLSKAYAHVSEQALGELQRKYPASFFLLLLRGRLNETKGDWQQAQKAYEAALTKRPDASGLQERLAFVSRMASGDGAAVSPPVPREDSYESTLALWYSPPAKTEISRLLQDYTSRVHGLKNASSNEEERLYRQVDYNQVLSYLTALWITENDPGSYRAHQLNGQLAEARGKTDEAVAAYRRALQLKPDLQNIHFSIGTLLWAAGRIQEALPELRAELQLNPNHPEAHYEIADILYTEQKLAEAKEHLLACLQLAPDMPEAHLAVERIYSTEGQYDKAIEHMNTAMRLTPEDPTPHYRLSQIYRKLGDDEKVKRELQLFRELRAKSGAE
jgi:tetratricopeptide (TPR) repeat protein